MRRRLFGAVLTAAMLVSLVPALPTAAAATRLPTPVVEWVTEDKIVDEHHFLDGQVALTDIPESMPNYRVEIKDAAGNIFDQYEDGFGGYARTVQEIWVGWYTNEVMPSGTYTASVTYLGNNGVTYTDSETATTQPYTYTAPGVSYAVPPGVAWNGANFSYTVEEAAQGQVIFMDFAIMENGTPRHIGCAAESVRYLQQTNNQTFVDRFNQRVNEWGPGEYVFRVRVISTDITEKWHSYWSDWSQPRYISGADEGLTGSLGNIIQGLPETGATNADKQAAVDKVQALDQEELLLALSADQDGTGVTKQLQELEQALDLTTDVQLAADSGLSLDTSKVKVVGAALNAQNLTAPTFTIGEPTEELEIPNTYKNTVQLDFSLPGAATNEDGTLKVPIQITMPVPENIDPARLRIIHFRNNGTRDEFTPHIFQDGGTWMARFAVSSLSPFVFGECSQLPTPKVEWLTADKTIDGTTYKAGQVVMTEVPDVEGLQYHAVLKNSSGQILEEYTEGRENSSNVEDIKVGWYAEGVLPADTYSLTVYYRGDGETWQDSEPVTVTYTYTQPATAYATPTGVNWDGSDFAYTVPEDNYGSRDNLYIQFGFFGEDAESTQPKAVRHRGGSLDPSQEDIRNQRFQERFAEFVSQRGEGYYRFRVRVLSYYINDKSTSPWSEWSDARYLTGADQGLIDELDTILTTLGDSPNAEAKQTAINAVQAMDQEKLLQALAADQKAEGVAAKLAELEEKLGLETNVEKDSAYRIDVDTDLVTVTGAGLSASSVDTAPTFTISVPQQDLTLPAGYRNDVRLDFSLSDVDADENGTLKVPIQITLPVPGNLNPDKLRILHYKDGSLTETITPYTFQKNDKWMARFTVNSLSPFVFAEYQPLVVTFDPNGGTVTPGTMTVGEDGRLTGALPTPTRPGYSFQYWSTALENGQQVTNAYVFTKDTTVYALWTESQTPSGGGGGGSTPTYSNTASKSENGSVTLSSQSAAKGSTVTVNVKPDPGYVLDTLTVTDKDGNIIEVTKTSDGKYTFKMPGSAVTVKATFKEKAPAVAALPFGDVAESAWYRDAVAYVYEKGIMTGTGDGTFSPNQNLTRGMMVTMLYRLAGEPALSGSSSFTDVASGAWYADSAAWASANGVASGYGGGKFGPEDPITREQMALFLYNYAKLQGEDLTASADLSTFTDGAQVSDWARYAMQWAVGKGLIQGSNSALNPQGAATRAEVAQLFTNLLQQD